MKIKDIYPLTPLQEGIYFHWKISKSMYFEQSSYKIQGELDINFIKESYDQLIARHDVLRTCFLDNVGEDILQVVQNEVPSNFQYLDITENPLHTIASLKQEDISNDFDLTKGSQMRLMVVKTDKDIYEFIWSHHHIVMDGWCIGILIKEFFIIYEGLLQGKKDVLSKIRPYAEYVKWLMKNDKEKAVQYWNNYLDGFQGKVGLPFQKQDTNAYKPGEVFYTINKDLREKLTAFCQQNSVTENVFFQTIWGILLAKYNNTNDVVFGGIVSGRPAEIQGVESIIGLFINTIPLRVLFEKEDTVKQILLNVQQKSIESLPYHYQSIAEIQLNANRNQQLFDHIMVFENYPVEEMIAGELSSENKKANIKLLETDSYEGEGYDFSLVVVPGKETLVRFTYNAAKYIQNDIESLKRHFEYLLNQAVENFEKPVSEIELLNESEKESILLWSGHASLIDCQEYTLIEMFETAAAEKPAHTALTFGKNQYSFAELNVIACQFAHFLKKQHKVRLGDFVAIQLERSDLLVIALLGVLKAGGVCVPLDINLPLDRVNYILMDTDCTIVINEELINRFKNYPKTDLILSNTDVAPSDLAYVMYTSGSAGKPKGVLVEHRNICALFNNAKVNFSLNQEPVMPLLASSSSDIFLFELFYPLLSKGKTVVLSNEEIKDISELTRNLSHTNCFHAVPTLMKTIIDDIKTNENENKYNHINAVFIGGDKIPAGLLEETRAVFSNAAIHVLYGQTEGSVFITTQSYQPGVKQFQNAVIGETNVYNAAYVLDDNLKLCPFYSIGELCISGNQVAQGYWNKPEITAEKFIKNPFKANLKLFKTGDLVRKLPNGKMEFVGRKGNQVKVKGYKIELEAIEKALLAHKNIEFAIARTIAVSENEKQIAAYVKAVKPIKAEEISLFLQEIVPPFMVPDYYIQLDEIPLMMNGKVDFKKLPYPLITNAIKEESAEPKTDVEIKLATIWKRILNREITGVNDNFFHLGGHSLKMIKLSNQILAGFNVHISVKEIYAHHTIKQQGAFIDGALNKNITSIPKATSAASYPLSSSQYRIWNICTLNDEANKAYNIRLIDIKNIFIDKDILAKALHSLILRHEILRTAFVTEKSGEPRQIIIPAEQVKPLKIYYKDLRQSQDPDKDLQLAIEESGDVSFDLEEGQLIKIELISLKDNQWIISALFHHLVFDGWSTDVFVNELYTLYEKYSQGQEPDLAPLEIQYKDYAAWEQNLIKSGDLKSHKEYWLQQFEGDLPILNELGDKKRPKIRTYNGAVISNVVEGDVLKELKLLCANQEASLFMFFLAITNVLVNKNTGYEDVIIGSPIFNRDYPELFDQIGFYANTIALRTRFDENASFLDILTQVKDNVLKAMEHQKFPMDELINALDIKYDASRNPLFDLVVTIREENKKTSDLNPYDATGNNTNSKFDLTLDFLIVEDQLTITLQYNTDVFSAKKITSLLHHLEQILLQVASKNDQKISAVDCLTLSEKKYLLEELSGHQTEYPRELSIIELFEKQAVLTPQKIALVYQNQKYSYQKLNEIANQLANYLKDHTNITGDFAAIILSKSEWQIISILAVLKSGCAYIPVSTDYPQERINYIIKDSNTECLVDTALIEEFVKTQQNYSTQFETQYAKANDLAYVMYTSGSTGEPKGVLIQQQSVVRLVKNTKFINLTGEEILLATGSFSFDATTFEYWGMLLNGGTLVMCDENTLLSTNDMSDVIARENVTIMWLTAGWLHQLVDENISLFQNLKTILCGGDVLSPYHITKLKTTYPELVIINGYGPTENTTFSITHTINLPIESSVPIGVPISNSTVYIMDKNHRLVPKGVIGEIYVGGDGIARGYLNNPELTNAKFLNNPYNTKERLYKTGDLGKWSNNNTIEFIGRRDNQVKVRGYRIELGEIENILCTHDSITSALVVIKDDLTGEKSIIAYVVSDQNTESHVIKDWLRTRVPNYMIPNHFAFLNEFPLNINGKIDRNKLPEIEFSLADRKEYILPQTTTQKALAEIWENVLGIEKIGLLDNFFEIGGHSLKAVKMFNLINNQFDVRIMITDLFNNPTLESLANEIDNMIWANKEEPEDVESDNITI